MVVRGPLSTQPGVEGVAQCVAQPVEAEHSDADRRPGTERQPPVTVDEVALPRVDHEPPVGRRRRRRQTEERERGFREHRRRRRQSDLNDQRVQQVRQHVAADDPGCRGPERPRRGYEVEALQLQHLRSGQTRVNRHLHDPDRDHRVLEAGSQRSHQCDRQDEGGEGEDAVDQPHEEQVGGTAAVAGCEADRTPDGETHRNGNERHRQRNAPAPDDSRQHVPSELVGAEQMRKAGTEARVVRIYREWVAGCDPVCDKRRHRQEEQEEQSHDDPGVIEQQPSEPGRALLFERDGQLIDAGVSRGSSAHAYEILGSSQAYRTSTSRLASMNERADMRTMPWTTGKSFPKMLSTASLPTPGQLKTVSVTSAPSRMAPIWRPTMVTTGMRAFLRAWWLTTRSRLAPFARAVRM